MKSPAAPTLRELLALARERLGPRAAQLKTRAELLDALGLDAPRHAAKAGDEGLSAPKEPPAVDPGPVVTRDFFVEPGR